MSIQAQLDTIVDSFSKSANGLFEITGRYHAAFEQGIYGCAIAKPTKRMRLALGVDREILVVASLFSDQQQRIIKFIKNEIENSFGRFENNIAIVIHFDPEGNSKIRNWGRDQSISILPINFNSPLVNSVDLEKRISVELYSHDPFDVTGPVSDDANFYGRRDEAIDLARKLQRGQIRSCLGIRKIGKTSIINRILKEIQGNYSCMCIMVDCSRDDVFELDAAKMLNSLRNSIDIAATDLKNYSIIVPISSEIDLKIARDELEETILRREEPIVFIFDEVDYITPGSPTRQAWRTDFNPFWRNLRSIYQECDRQRRPMSILVGGVSTYWFTVESVDGIENAALAFIPEEFLSPMPEGAIVAMIKRLGRIAGLEVDDEACKMIARATGSMPYWARKCCSYMHRNISVQERPCHITAKRAEPLVDSFVAEEGSAIAEVALSHLFRVHPLLMDATTKCFEGKGHLVSEPLRRVLRKYGVISISNELSGAMLSRAFSAIKSEPKSDLSTRDEIIVGGLRLNLDEWAEELATLGKRRNLLERRIRDLALNFIRFDALSTGRAQEAKTRILAAIVESRRTEMSHLTVEEAINKFLWTDLYKLVIKEWKLFEKIFGDRVDFESNCVIVNDRPDTHAKDADQADVALYRRALQRLEERLAKIQ
ncbi:hypothetical protein ACFSQQ_09740 [Mesorhizobium kowhaii]|uniref:hypothetical protein n=1 Tax=Mesorhizobium kowhaii TaxID=1300272 RepID=UPI0035E56EAC